VPRVDFENLLSCAERETGHRADPGSTAIPNYRAYAVWPDGNFEGFEALICADDDQAAKQARCLIDQGPIELWSGERFVTRIEPEVKVVPPADAIMGLKTTPATPLGRFARGIRWLCARSRRSE
jgi:hypothetical protein